jgi:hypothetical protein
VWNSIRRAVTIRRSPLRVYFDPASTYQQHDSGDPGGLPGYFCHLMVRNEGRAPARSCRGRLLEVSVQNPDGSTSPAPGFFAPVFLKWAREPDFEARDVGGDQPRRLDLCFALASAPDQLRFFAPPSPSGVLIFPPGVYRVSVRVTADGVRPVHAVFRVDFTRGWDQIVVADDT